MSKLDVRKKIIIERNKLSLQDIESYSKKITNNLINLDLYKKATSIFIYISFGSEVNTIDIINDALKCGKEIYVPKTDKVNREMKAIRIHNFDNMVVDKWGILEPETVDKNKIGTSFDLIIIPGVAFDRRGNRIGYGGGYYDKYLSKLNSKSSFLALAYDFQVISRIESEKHDIKVNYIITEKGILKI